MHVQDIVEENVERREKSKAWDSTHISLRGLTARCYATELIPIKCWEKKHITSSFKKK
jgi:hypothetical protein